MEKFVNFTENLMRVILVPDESSDSISNVSQVASPEVSKAPIDNFTKNVADYLGHFEAPSEEEGEETSPELEGSECGCEDKTVEGEESPENAENSEESSEEASSDFSVTHDTDGLKITMQGVDFTFPPEVVEKIKEVLMDSDVELADEVSTDDTMQDVSSVEDAMFGSEEEKAEDSENQEHEASETEEEETEEREEDEDEEKVNESLIEDGFMDHMHDLHGLKNYLVSSGIISSESTLTDSEDSAAHLRRKGYKNVYVMDSYEERGRWTLRVYDPVTQNDVYTYDSDTEDMPDEPAEMTDEDYGDENFTEGFVPFKKKGKGKGKNKSKKSKDDEEGDSKKPWEKNFKKGKK